MVSTGEDSSKFVTLGKANAGLVVDTINTVEMSGCVFSTLHSSGTRKWRAVWRFCTNIYVYVYMSAFVRYFLSACLTTRLCKGTADGGHVFDISNGDSVVLENVTMENSQFNCTAGIADGNRAIVEGWGKGNYHHNRKNEGTK